MVGVGDEMSPSFSWVHNAIRQTKQEVLDLFEGRNGETQGGGWLLIVAVPFYPEASACGRRVTVDGWNPGP